MRIVTAQELENWLMEGKVLEKDARGPKVLALADGSFLKIFYTRRRPFWLVCFLCSTVRQEPYDATRRRLQRAWNHRDVLA